MITDGKKWYYLAAKKLCALFRGITSKHDGEFYCLNFFVHTVKNLKKLKKHKKVCKSHNYFYVEMPK